MPKRSSKSKLNHGEPDASDADESLAIQQPSQPPELSAPPAGKNPAAVMLGRLGGAKGGKARAAKLSAKQRSEIAKKAAQARWRKK